ncbi:hypothetical protein FHR32_002730 [Streptosporangium album]|uniref:Transposase IS4-like domain-containing protein n=1 Tax=Streptosporangium album TaxID=47479 RepID=A0A7W7RUG9_9ACTN|nr:hypothetical protein [Streptosporangium album]
MAHAGVAERVHAAALRAFDLVIGLDLNDVSVDGCITKAPCGGDAAGPSPVDRAKGGLKRSTATEGGGIPLGIVSAPANRHDPPLLGPTLDAALTQVKAMPDGVIAHLDAAYDNAPSRAVLEEPGFTGEISRKGVPAPIQVGKRWVVERTNSWMNGYGRVRRCTDRDGQIVDFYLYPALCLPPVVRACGLGAGPGGAQDSGPSPHARRAVPNQLAEPGPHRRKTLRPRRAMRTRCAACRLLCTK